MDESDQTSDVQEWQGMATWIVESLTDKPVGFIFEIDVESVRVEHFSQMHFIWPERRVELLEGCCDFEQVEIDLAGDPEIALCTRSMWQSAGFGAQYVPREICAGIGIDRESGKAPSALPETPP